MVKRHGTVAQHQRLAQNQDLRIKQNIQRSTGQIQSFSKHAKVLRAYCINVLDPWKLSLEADPLSINGGSDSRIHQHTATQKGVCVQISSTKKGVLLQGQFLLICKDCSEMNLLVEIFLKSRFHEIDSIFQKFPLILITSKQHSLEPTW